MFKSLHKTLGVASLSAAMAFGAALPANAADITFGWTAWADAEFVTKLAKDIIEENWDYDVELTMSDIALQFEGVANGDIDGMMMAWLPETHADYWERYQDDVVDLGPLYDGAVLGWAVPDYIPEDKLDSIEDLKDSEIHDKLEGIIQGIDPGAGLMRLSKETVKTYGLDNYQVRSASESAMTAALDRAINRDEWIVVTAWTPHWMFGSWDLRFLDDPKGSLGGEEHIDAVVREGFKEDFPEVAQFMENYYIPLDMLQKYMFKAQEDGYDTAIAAFKDDHGDMIEEWLAGD